MRCRKDSGRIALLRGAAPDVRYVGRCDDCGLATEPTSIASARLALNAHYRSVVVRIDSRRGCVCAECAPAHAAARKAALEAEIAERKPKSR